MSLLGVVCVAMWLVPTCGHRVVNAEMEIRQVICQDEKGVATQNPVTAEASGPCPS